MSRIFLSILSILFALFIRVETFSQANPPVARKFDEFGDIQLSDLKARLDNFAVQLQHDLNTRGFIVVYRSRKDLPGLSHALALRSRDYILANRSVPADRLALVDGGVAMCITQELWIVPHGSALKPRGDARIGYFHWPDHAWKFYEYHFLPPELYRRFDISEPIGETDRLDAYANEVKKNRTFVACIIVYAQYDSSPGLVDYSGDYDPKRDVRLDPAGTARRRLAVERNDLIRIYGVPSSRIRLIDGGHRKSRAVELWIVPAGEPLPIPTPNSFPSKRLRNTN